MKKKTEPVSQKLPLPVLGGSSPENPTEDSKASNPEEQVIYDECGDTMWDRVLAQDAAGQINGIRQLK